MALGQFPSLSSVKTALNSASNSLSAFIVEAGKSGVWDRLSNFAYYANVSFGADVSALFFDLTYSSKIANIISPNHGWVLSSKPDWLTVYPGSGNGDTQITVTVDSSIGTRSGFIIFTQSITTLTFSIYIEQGAVE